MSVVCFVFVYKCVYIGECCVCISELSFYVSLCVFVSVLCM